ncbi:uncharacterized protein LOC133844220 [Drosophila sulfurigaster albostrigata]|uniref:uncharacterized protein LOC133844220 n=1 Tax=Drosophila sulfurigaster albostrigata TaxID=89887 RepID=UPI002D21CC39|nr:uncharacterized protein LOC133844220 [Drosophila sulfurigaster albostrigata]
MSTKVGDVQYLRCLKCLKTIKCSRYDTGCLVRHVQTHHPEIIENANDKVQNLHKLAAEHGISEERLSQISKMTGISEAEMADEAERYLAKHKPPSGSQPSQKSGSQTWQEPKITDSKDINRRQYYRSSIERWLPTDGCIYCPSCGCNRRPVLRSSSEFYSSTGCPASCVANCWPFCFLPCLTSPDNREYLHCSNCNSFLGIYDREHNCIRPNREFVPH